MTAEDDAATVLVQAVTLTDAVRKASSDLATAFQVQRMVIAYASRRGLSHSRIADAADLMPVEVNQIVREEAASPSSPSIPEDPR